MSIVGVAGTWAAKFGLTALYKAVKGFWDSYWEKKRKDKELQKLEGQAFDRVQFAIAKKAFSQLKEVVEAREKIERDHQGDTLHDTLHRMRLRSGNKS